MKLVALTKAEWHEWRINGVGGSDAGAIMGVLPWRSRGQCWGEKTERAQRQKKNRAMMRGLQLESAARKEYERLTGIVMEPAFGENEEHPEARASFDGLSLEFRRVLEIKCPGSADHRVALAGRIPAKYIWQCVHLCLVSGFDQVDYFSFDGKQGVIVAFKRDPKLEKRYLAELKAFWAAVLRDEYPPPLKSAAKRPQPAQANVISFQERVKKIREAKLFPVKTR